MQLFRRIRHEDKGALVVEFALIVPILFFIVFGIVDFGRAYFTMNNLAAAVREGARLGATQKTPDANEIKQRVKDFAFTFGGQPLDASGITATIDTKAGLVTVTASYTFRPITPLLKLIGRSTIPMRQTAVFRWEWTE